MWSKRLLFRVAAKGKNILEEMHNIFEVVHNICEVVHNIFDAQHTFSVVAAEAEVGIGHMLLNASYTRIKQPRANNWSMINAALISSSV